MEPKITQWVFILEIMARLDKDRQKKLEPLRMNFAIDEITKKAIEYLKNQNGKLE